MGSQRVQKSNLKSNRILYSNPMCFRRPFWTVWGSLLRYQNQTKIYLRHLSAAPVVLRGCFGRLRAAPSGVILGLWRASGDHFWIHWGLWKGLLVAFSDPLGVLVDCIFETFGAECA